jgi:Xaa-Pro aminopeptidase
MNVGDAREGVEALHSAEDLAEYKGRIERLRRVMREADFDAVIIGGSGGRYSSYLAGFDIAGTGSMDGESRSDFSNVVLVVPISGDPRLVVPAGFLRSHIAAARLRSWFPIVTSTYSEDPDWELKTYWGLYSPELANDVAGAIRASGLKAGRIGIIGQWPGMEETKSQFPQARFAPGVAKDANGAERDLVDLISESVTSWELAKLRDAQAAGDEGLRTFMHAAVDGALYRDVVHAAISACERTCTEAHAFIAVSAPGRPWIGSLSGTFPPDSRFRKGDLVSVEFINRIDWYWVQNCRSWVVGRAPDETQKHVLETTKSALDEMTKLLKPGVTGDQMWNLTLQIFKRANLEPWARSGHPMGFRFTGGDSRFEFLPGNHTPLPNNFVLVAHPFCIDRASMNAALIGDTVVVDESGARILSDSPLPYDFTV